MGLGLWLVSLWMLSVLIGVGQSFSSCALGSRHRSVSRRQWLLWGRVLPTPGSGSSASGSRGSPSTTKKKSSTQGSVSLLNGKGARRPTNVHNDPQLEQFFTAIAKSDSPTHATSLDADDTSENKLIHRNSVNKSKNKKKGSLASKRPLVNHKSFFRHTAHDSTHESKPLRALTAKQNAKRAFRLNSYAWWMSHDEEKNPRIFSEYQPWWAQSNFPVDETWSVHDLLDEAKRRGLHNVDHHKQELIDRINLSFRQHRLTNDNYFDPIIIPVSPDSLQPCYPEVYESGIDR